MIEFNIANKGKIIMEEDAFLSEWYLLDPGDVSRKNPHHVNAEWFYERLKDNEEGIYRFCSQIKCKTDSEILDKEIKKYEDMFEEDLGDGGMDTWIYLLEKYIQEACNEPNLHWW